MRRQSAVRLPSSIEPYHEMSPDDARRSALNIAPLVVERIALVPRRVRRRGKVSRDPVHEAEYVIDARADAVVAACFFCGLSDLEERADQVTVHDLPMHGIPTTIRCKMSKYVCRNCDQEFRTRMVGIEPARRMTTRLRKALEDRVLKRKYDQLAEDYGVSEGTIRTIADELVDCIEQTWEVRTPRVLGIDDVWIDRKARTVFVDSETGEVLHLADSKEKIDVQAGLRLFSADIVEAVTMDMDRTYRPIVRAEFPKAKIVFDKFHVSNLANELMSDIRIVAQGHYLPRSKTIGKEWKRTFSFRRRNLPKRKGDALNDNVLPDVQLLVDAYNLKEDFLDILDGASSERARTSFANWRLQALRWLDHLADYVLPQHVIEGIAEHVRDFINLIDKETGAVFAGLDEGLTNARVESANGWIRTVEGVRQGYSYDMLKARVLYGRLTPSRDLFECDVCGGRFREPQTESIPVGGSWNALDHRQWLFKQYCNDCSHELVDRMSATAPGELSPPLERRSTRPIRDRSRVQKRKRYTESRKM